MFYSTLKSVPVHQDGLFVVTAPQKQANVFAAVCTINPGMAQSPQRPRHCLSKQGLNQHKEVIEMRLLTVDLNQFLGFLKVV